jgi:ABC-type multidrug transport system permease subunit
MRSPLAHLVLARLRESFRQPETIFWTFLFPTLLAVALGVAFRGGRPDPSAAVVVAADGYDRIVRTLGSDNSIRVEVQDRRTAELRLRTGRAALVVIPGNPLVYRFDPTRAESHLARANVDAAIQRAAGRADPVPVVDERVTEPGSRYIDFLIPGLLGMNLMGGGLWGIGWSIVDLRIRKLLKLQLAAPMRRRDFLLSHILTRMCFIPLEVIPLLVLAGWIFNVTMAGSALGLTVVVTAGALSFAGLGTLLASRARTTEMIYGLINLCTLPMFVLSGVFFSTSRFPDALQPLIKALPLTALIDALRAVINDGASVLSLGPQFLVLGLWGVLSFAGTRALFRWS